MAGSTSTGTGAPPANAAVRTPAVALAEALPDALACAACALAWAKPLALPGVDLVAWAAPLFLIQLPLAFIALFAGVARLSDAEMSRATKAGFVLAPAFAMALLAPAALGGAALTGVVLLSATVLWRIATGQVDREAPVRGAWITFTQGGGADGRPRRAYSVATGGAPAGPAAGGRQWRVEAGHSQVMAALTAAGGLMLLTLLPFVDIERFGVTRAIEEASAWSATPVGEVVGAHYPLAGGVVLFAARFLLQFEGVAWGGRGDPPAPTPSIEDDPVLREIVDKVEGRKPRRRR